MHPLEGTLPSRESPEGTAREWAWHPRDVYLASRGTQKMTDNMASAVELKVEKLDLSFGCCLMVT
jgi:hypothetical protein